MSDHAMRNLAMNFIAALAAIALTDAGRAEIQLWGVTGQGTSPNETLYRIDLTTAGATLLTELGNGSDGEEIAFNPVNGLLYHFSGWNELNDPGIGQIMEFISPTTLSTTNVPLQAGGFDGSGYSEEVKGVTWNADAGSFLAVDLNWYLYSVDTAGHVTQIAQLDHLAKGLAVAGGVLYSLDNTFGAGAHLRKIDPLTGATIGKPVAVTLPGEAIGNGISLAAHPDTGTLWAVLKMSGNQRRLVTIDPVTGTAASVGTLSDAFASIEFVETGSCPDDTCPADLTGDESVNVFDLLELLGHWGACP